MPLPEVVRVASGGALRASSISSVRDQRGVVDPVASGRVDPDDRGANGDAEHLGEHDGGNCRGELLLGCASCGTSVDPEASSRAPGINPE